MMNVCTQAGLSNNEKRLLTPARPFMMVEVRLGDGLRESGDEGGESGAAGSREFERVFRESPRPDSSM